MEEWIDVSSKARKVVCTLYPLQVNKGADLGRIICGLLMDINFYHPGNQFWKSIGAVLQFVYSHFVLHMQLRFKNQKFYLKYIFFLTITK